MKHLFNKTHLHDNLNRVREFSPLIHNITNHVVMQTSANMLLAIGASPLMAHAHDELEAISKMAQTLVLNIGTLDPYWIESMLKAQLYSKQQGLPIVFDPVGVGISSYRLNTARQIIEHGVDVIRGNASEILALSQLNTLSHGVDSLHQSDAAVTAAMSIAKQYQCCVVISGKKDIICDSKQLLTIDHGSVLLTKVTGMGCSSTALIGAFVAVNKNYLEASAAAMTLLSLAAETAASRSNGIGSFYVNLLDALFDFSTENLTTLNCEVA